MPTRFKQIVCCIAAGLLAGCSTQQAGQELSGVAMGVGPIVALPLLPLMIPYAVIQDRADAKERKSDRELYKILDPVYRKRIQMIMTRSPQADADKVWSEQKTVFLGGNYPQGMAGLEGTGFSFSPEYNQKQIAGDEFLTALQNLLSPDPLQSQAHQWSGTYIQFNQSREEYEKAFNIEMCRKITESRK